MKNIQSLLPLIICFIVLNACQKETSQDQSSGSAAGRVKTYTETIISSSAGNSTTTFTISYDNSGRITSMISATSPGDKLLYSFPSANKFTMDMYGAGSLLIHEDFYLNTNSFIDSTFQFNNEEDTITEKYFYDINGRLIQLNEYEFTKATGSVLSNTITYTYDAAGDMVKASGTDTNIEIYEYYPDPKYTLPVVPGPVNANSVKKVHLPKKLTVVSNGSVVGTAQFTYTFDDKDRVITEKAEAYDGSTAIKTYTYF
jgi:hypothetical protein